MVSVGILKVCVLIIPFTVFSSVFGQSYTYDNPSEWNDKFPICNGDRQSPIDLVRDEALDNTNLPKLSFTSYNRAISKPVQARNNGHSIEITVNNAEDGIRPSVTGGGVNDTYEALSFHFHWGSPNSTGSEHLINDKQYDVELHIVHKNTRFETIEEATADPSGLLVLGIMLKKWQILPTLRTGLNVVYDALPNLSKYQSEQTLNKTITMDSILSGINTRRFYTYQGSLTTPPCAQAVTWFVFPDVVPIQSRFLKRFFNIYDNRGQILWNNFRPIQDTNDRDVFFREGVQFKAK